MTTLTARGTTLLALATLVLGGTATPASADDARKPTCHGKVATIVGTDKRDTITGTPGNDVIVAKKGRDNVDGRGGDDVICGGPAVDMLVGGHGDDLVDGQEDGRYLEEDGYIYVPNRLAGGPGNDQLIGGGGAPDDLFFVGATRGVRVDFNQNRSTGQGTDTLVNMGDVLTTRFDDTVVGSEWSVRTGRGDDVITVPRGSYGDIYAGAGDDEATGGNGFVFGQKGDDVLVSRGDLAGLRGGSGNDTLTATGSDVQFAGGPGNDVIRGTSGRDEIYLGPLNDNTFPSGRDVVYAGGGNDSIEDGTGSARIYAGQGNDLLEGSFGNDTYVGGDGYDRFYPYFEVAPTSGIVLDLADGSMTGGLGTKTMKEFEDISATELNDTLRGDAESNTFTGGGGNDRIVGRGGDDWLFGESGTDSADGGAGTDKCRAETVANCEKGSGRDERRSTVRYAPSAEASSSRGFL